MTYIKLEDVIDEIWCYIEDWYEDEVRRLLNTLPSIDPESMIEEMQIQNKASFDYLNDRLAWPVREKLLQELLQRIRSSECNSKKVSSTDAFGKTVVYKSTLEAEKQTWVNNSSISQVCNGKRKKAGGFIWNYL